MRPAASQRDLHRLNQLVDRESAVTVAVGDRALVEGRGPEGNRHRAHELADVDRAARVAIAGERLEEIGRAHV